MESFIITKEVVFRVAENVQRTPQDSVAGKAIML